MNLLQQFLISVRFRGLSDTLKTVLYSQYQSKINKRFGIPSAVATAKPTSPGKFESIRPFHNGAVFSFNNGFKLEVAFLSMRSVRVTWQPGELPLNYGITGEATIALRVEN